MYLAYGFRSCTELKFDLLNSQRKEGPSIGNTHVSHGLLDMLLNKIS
jgi:hypothetical protein